MVPRWLYVRSPVPPFIPLVGDFFSIDQTTNSESMAKAADVDIGIGIVPLACSKQCPGRIEIHSAAPIKAGRANRGRRPGIWVDRIEGAGPIRPRVCQPEEGLCLGSLSADSQGYSQSNNQGDPYQLHDIQILHPILSFTLQRLPMAIS